MNAIEIKNLSKNFRGMYAADHLTLCGRRCIVCIWSWRNQQGCSQKDELSIKHWATLKIGVAFSQINTFGRLCCSN